MSFSNRVATVQRWLDHPRAAAAIVAVGALAVCASLTAGLAADDLWHQLVLERSRAFAGFDRSPFDLFRFASPEWNAALIDAGVFPWWADPEVRFGFVRPLSALTHFVDHVLWPSSGVMMHAHNIVWWVASVASVGVLYRRLIAPRWLAHLALFLYALDDARGAPVAWIANRNALVGCAASVWTLYFYHRARTEGFRPGAWLGPTALVVGYAGSEGSIAMLGYLVAYALFLDDRAPGKRALSLAPYFAVTAVWFIVSKALGYGVERSGVYLDPLGDFGLFLQVLPERFAILLFAQLGGPWSEGWNAYPAMFPGLEKVVLVAAVVAIAFVAWLVAPVLRKSAPMRFWVVGTLFSIVPSCAAFPADRMLSWVSIGGMGMLAELFGAAARRELPQIGVRGHLARLGIGGLIVAHVVAAPLLISMRSRGIAEVRAAIDRADRNIPRTPDVRKKTVVYVNPPADPFAAYIPIHREALGIPRPLRQRWLTTGASPIAIETLDDRTLEVRPEGGFMHMPSERLLRSPKHPVAVGEPIDLTGLTVTVTRATEDGRPAAARFRFDEPLLSNDTLFLVWKGGGYEQFHPPPPGHTVQVDAVDLMRVTFGDESPVARVLGR